MVDALVGAGTFFVMLAINKAIIEPLATSVGRKLLDRHLGVACSLLDAQLDKHGLDFDAEGTVRKYLDLSNDPELSAKEYDTIIEEVFKQWDLRKVTHSPTES